MFESAGEKKKITAFCKTDIALEAFEKLIKQLKHLGNEDRRSAPLSDRSNLVSSDPFVDIPLSTLPCVII